MSPILTLSEPQCPVCEIRGLEEVILWFCPGAKVDESPLIRVIYFLKTVHLDQKSYLPRRFDEPEFLACRHFWGIHV